MFPIETLLGDLEDSNLPILETLSGTSFVKIELKTINTILYRWPLIECWSLPETKLLLQYELVFIISFQTKDVTSRLLETFFEWSSPLLKSSKFGATTSNILTDDIGLRLL